jgi:hypothetical protein
LTGDNSFWEAVDLWCGAIANMEWHDPWQVTTGDGNPITATIQQKGLMSGQSSIYISRATRE